MSKITRRLKVNKAKAAVDNAGQVQDTQPVQEPLKIIEADPGSVDIHMTLQEKYKVYLEQLVKVNGMVENAKHQMFNYARQAAILHGIPADEWDKEEWEFQTGKKRFIKLPKPSQLPDVDSTTEVNKM